MPDITREIDRVTERLREALDAQGVELTRDVLRVAAINAVTALTEDGLVLSLARTAQIPAPGEWPCQTQHRPELYGVRLHAFLYVLLRDGAKAPGDIEQNAINAAAGPHFDFTNPWIESYAHALATFLMADRGNDE